VEVTVGENRIGPSCRERLDGVPEIDGRWAPVCLARVARANGG